MHGQHRLQVFNVCSTDIGRNHAISLIPAPLPGPVAGWRARLGDSRVTARGLGRQHQVMGLGPLQTLPDRFWQVPYVGDRYPGAVPRGQVELGANCQLWVYEVLAHFGHTVADLRSDDLWHDRTCAILVEDPAPLDLVLFNHHHDPYGAHIGIWTGDAVAHLCKEVGTPAVWELDQFRRRPRYRTLIGFKRPARSVGAAEGGSRAIQ